MLCSEIACLQVIMTFGSSLARWVCKTQSRILRSRTPRRSAGSRYNARAAALEFVANACRETVVALYGAAGWTLTGIRSL